MKKKQKTISNSIRKEKKTFKALVLLLFVVFLDQVSKHYVNRIFPLGSSFEVIRGFLYITHLTNTGVSFGMFKGFNIFFVAVSIAALFFFVRMSLKNIKYLLPISLVCAGVIGNLIDRVSLGYVIDFIEFRFFPVFNIADSAITLGVIWLVILTLKNKEDLF
jgi:signal peptidase II